MNSAREWTLFAGALFTLMGVSLAAAARRNAEDALSWQRQWHDAVGAPESARGGEPDRDKIVLAYRLGGIIFAVIGLGFFLAAATGRAPLTVHAGGRGSLAGGVVLTLCGAVMAVNAWQHLGRKALPLGERVAAACAHGMIALLFIFGFRLLREGMR